MIARIPQPATLAEISEANPGWKVERETDGSFTMSPTGSLSGAHDMALAELLIAWKDRAGGQLFGSSTGFTMPDGAVLSPDMAWMAAERWAAIPFEERDDYAHVVPDICIEIASKTDNALQLIQKLRRYRAYGASYVLLIDPFARTTWSDGVAPAGFPTSFVSVFDAGIT